LRLGLRREALTIALQARGLDLEAPQLYDALGSLLTHVEEPALALPYFQDAVQSCPDNIDFRYNLAMAQRMIGAFEDAETNLDKVIAARPADGEAHHARSDLRKQTRERNHISQLEAVLGQQKGQRAAIPVAFALAKELEDLGEHARSFACLRTACNAYRASLRYNVADDVAVLDKLRTTFSSELLERLRSKLDTHECIFITGLPRSGTTLVDRILGSHSDVYSAGELDAFPRVIIDAVSRREGRAVSKLELVECVLKLDFDQIGRAYIDATRPRTGHTPRFTDKMPLNYLYAGLIHAALPQARFVALRRHPMDSCYAMYKTLFAAAYPFTYSLTDLSCYYVAWDRLMRHWERVIGDAWLSVNYEDLVADQERVSRKILADCGLAWQDRCLDFHANSAAVTTASARHVRSPLYADSVGKWRSYARELEPLALYLKAHGISIP
jgi:tetratricopeptide (TPR) repeat protein